jgi:oxygen-dependent protoporphyrinogen oxidase
MNPLRVTIIGAGVSGLAAANRLLELSKEKNIPLDLNVLEAGPKAGGTLSTIEKEGFLMEEGPDCFITEKPAGINLIKRLDMEWQLMRTNADLKQSFILKGDRLFPIPEGFYLLAPSRLMPIMTTPLISFWGKIRAALEPFVKVRRDPQDESVGAFVRRRLGKELFEGLAQPLIGGVYNADPDDVSLNAAMPKFKEMEIKYGSLLKAMAARRLNTQAQVSGARYSLFVTLQKGMKSLADNLLYRIPSQSLWLESPVESLKQNPNHSWNVETKGRSQETDAVVLAIPPNKMVPLLGHLDKEWQKLLNGVPAHDSATLNLGFRRKDIGHALNGFGFVVPAREKKLILGCTFSSQKFFGRAPHDFELIRVFLGAKAVQQLKVEGEDAIVHKVIEELTPILNLKSAPVVHHLAVYNASMSYFKPGHLSLSARLEDKASEQKGLYLAGNGLKGVGIPDCIASGEAAAEKIFKDFTANPS